MTVQELIAMLNAIEDKTRPVWVEGCDCLNPWNGRITVEQVHPRTPGASLSGPTESAILIGADV